MCFYFSLLKELKRTNPFEKFEYVDYYLFMVMLKNLFMMLYATEVNDQLSLNNMQWSTERNRRKKKTYEVLHHRLLDYTTDKSKLKYQMNEMNAVVHGWEYNVKHAGNELEKLTMEF